MKMTKSEVRNEACLLIKEIKEKHNYSLEESKRIFMVMYMIAKELEFDDKLQQNAA